MLVAFVVLAVLTRFLSPSRTWRIKFKERMRKEETIENDFISPWAGAVEPLEWRSVSRQCGSEFLGEEGIVEKHALVQWIA